MPWRATTNPYHIFVSEFMLQQTQAPRVVPKYERFIEKFPSFHALSEAVFPDVLQLWQGLGYNRRARWLHDAAKRIISDHKGRLPDDVEALKKIKGIGHATASEMVSFAYNKPTAFIETNIRRVFIYFFFPRKTDVKDKEIMKLVEYMVDKENPREWYYALMDYGVFLKKKYPKRNPNKRSAKYKKQSKFEGSDRQIRGKLLKLLLKKPGLTSEQIVNAISGEQNRILKLLQNLVGEEFVIEESQKYYIKND